MLIQSPLDSATHWLTASNIVYVAGAFLTFGAAVLVLLEKQAVLAGLRPKESFWAEASVVIAAAVSVLGTIGAIHFSNSVAHLKDIDLAAYKTAAGQKIAKAQSDAATANQSAADANKAAATANLENTKLRIELATDEKQEKKAEATLTAQNQKNAQFTQALAVQQQTMAQQIHTSPELDNAQINEIARELKRFAGQDVSIHTTSDTVVERLAASVAAAFHDAGVTTKYYSTDMGALYQGVSVAVHSPIDVPPLANAIVNSLRQFGIEIHPVSLPNGVSAGHVAIFLGPN